MSALNNRHWLKLDGTPITGRVPPRLRVYGPEMTAEQLGQVRHIYKLFTDVCLVAVGEYQVRKSELADGTKVRCTSFMGEDVVEVWTGGGGIPPFETLFYATPSSELHKGGYKFPGNQKAVVHAGDYTKTASLPPERFFESQPMDKLGGTTWFNPALKIQAEGYLDKVMPLVVSWRGKEFRYGRYMDYIPVSATTDEAFTQNFYEPEPNPETFPGKDHAATDFLSAHLGVLWLNDNLYTAPFRVYSAAIRRVKEGESNVAPEPGYYIYAADADDDKGVVLWRAKVHLPTEKKKKAAELDWVKLHTFDVEGVCYQGPFFNASCTKMVCITDIPTEEPRQPNWKWRDPQTCIIEYDVTDFTHTKIHEATMSGYSEKSRHGAEITASGGWTTHKIEESYAPIDPHSEVVEYGIAADYKNDELVFVIAKITYKFSYTHSKVYEFVGARFETNTITGDDNTSYHYWHGYEIIHNKLGVLRSFMAESEDSAHWSCSMQTADEYGNSLMGTLSVSLNILGAPGNHFTLGGGNYVQMVGGDLRQDLFVLLESVCRTDGRVITHQESSDDTIGFFTGRVRDGWTHTVAEVAFRSEEYATEKLYGTVLRYVVMHKHSTLYESSADRYLVPLAQPTEIRSKYGTSTFPGVSVEVRIPMPQEALVDPSSYPDGFVLNIPLSSVNEVAGGDYYSMHYMAPATLPYTAFVIEYGAIPNIHLETEAALISNETFKKAPECCNIAFSPSYETGDPDDKVFGYVSFISQQLYDVDGVAVPRDRFEKFYINGDWVAYDKFALDAGELQTLAAPIFIGTRLK